MFKGLRFRLGLLSVVEGAGLLLLAALIPKGDLHIRSDVAPSTVQHEGNDFWCH